MIVSLMIGLWLQGNSFCSVFSQAARTGA